MGPLVMAIATPFMAFPLFSCKGISGLGLASDYGVQYCNLRKKLWMSMSIAVSQFHGSSNHLLFTFVYYNSWSFGDDQEQSKDMACGGFAARSDALQCKLLESHGGRERYVSSGCICSLLVNDIRRVSIMGAGRYIIQIHTISLYNCISLI